MSRRINGSTQTATGGQGSIWAACIICALVWFMLIAPQGVLVDQGEPAYEVGRSLRL